jgi:glutaminyl-peptide cyclotransferase
MSLWRLRGAGAAVLVATGVALSTTTLPARAEPAAVPIVQPTVLAQIPHDPGAYTEGFELDGDTLYEGTGLVGKSELRAVDPETGAVRRAVPLPADYFGEGITVVGDRIWQLTYQDGVAIEWDKASLTPLREVPVSGDGWGLCHDGDRFIRSDGTGRLRFHDLATFAESGGVTVTRDGREVTGLNELECVDGQVWASLWPTDEIARIDPTSGAVNLVVDMSGLWRFGERSNGQVLSGIAHVDGQEFLVDGKNWPATFRVRIDSA